MTMLSGEILLSYGPRGQGCHTWLVVRCLYQLSPHTATLMTMLECNDNAVHVILGSSQLELNFILH